MMMEVFTDVLRNTLMITCFVMVIMLFIELLNLFTQGKWSRWLGKYKPLQVVIATVLGLIPGCFGGFAVVGMWTHGAISFGALIAAMISCVGDEAFVMLVQMPEKAFFLFGILFFLAIIVGITIDKLGIKVSRPKDMQQHLVVHEHEQMSLHDLFGNWKTNIKQLSFTRVLLISGLLLFIYGMSTGFFEHERHGEAVEAVSQNSFSLPLDEVWFNNIFLILALIVLFTFVFVDDHFLEEHLWHHIIRQHIPKIFLWTFAALLLIHFLMTSVDMIAWVEKNQLWVLLFAVLIGVIPESGPHLVFISLFLGGTIPFSILLANSITQDGHSTLPLLAESKRGFLAVKSVNVVLGLAVGLAGYWLGF
ncbi:MAG: putative manganese transporter [Bacteroidales bacterium]|nr:putative manganese transporter [Bacteroidales bacterium]